tara:strand:+ start:464 stop:637 length:174 start_codon:yes stop_codon:yes gene_type:complete
MDAQYISDKINLLKEEKQDLQSQLQYATNDSTIERLEEEIRELEHSISVIEKWKPNE